MIIGVNGANAVIDLIFYSKKDKDVFKKIISLGMSDDACGSNDLGMQKK